MTLRTGVDLIDIERVHETIERQGQKFIRRVFTQAEQDECAGRASSLAARFAAKEAVAKALGVGIGDVRWVDIEIKSDKNKAPYLILHGEGERLANELGLTSWSLSLSHTEEQAIAFVVAMSG